MQKVRFVLLSSKEHLQLFVDYVNKHNKCLKCISEAENDHSFSNIDIKITCHNQQFKTSIYKKTTFSGAFTHYESYVNQTYKKSLIDTLLFCCFSVCSDYTSFHLEIENIREIFKKYLSFRNCRAIYKIRSFFKQTSCSEKSNSNCSEKGTFCSTSISGNVIIQFKMKMKNLL